MGLIRLCFCCSCRTGEGCPGAGCGTEGPGTAAAGGWAAAGGAGEGRPLGAGTGSFCGVLGPLSSGPGPVGQEQHEQLWQVITLWSHRASSLTPWGPMMRISQSLKGRKKKEGGEEWKGGGKEKKFKKRKK